MAITLHRMLLLASASIACACPFDQVNVPKWNPLGQPYLITSGFADIEHDQTNHGLTFGTGTQTGIVVQAPEDGHILELSDSANAGGKSILFLGVSGHRWRLSNLESFTPQLDSLFEAQRLAKQHNDFTWPLPESLRATFKEYAGIAFSGRNQKGEGSFHLELIDPTQKQYLNLCEVGIACHDSVNPVITGAAVWDAARVTEPVRFTSAQALASGCLEVSKTFLEPRIALQIKDIATPNSKSTMGMHFASLRRGDQILYQRETQSLAVSNLYNPPEILWNDQQQSDGYWYSFGSLATPNPDIKGDAKVLAGVIRTMLHQPDKRSQELPLSFQIMDHRLNMKNFELTPRTSCTPPTPSVSANSLLYTNLGRAWIDFEVCKSGAKISLLDSAKQILVRNLCDTLTHTSYSVPQLLSLWPAARTITAGGSVTPSRRIAIHPLTSRMMWKQDGVFLGIQALYQDFHNAIAWEEQRTANTEMRWNIFPKGLPLTKPMQFCIPVKTPVPAGNKLFPLSQTHSAWLIPPAKQFKQEDSSVSLCTATPQISDMLFAQDTTAPNLGKAITGSITLRGRTIPVIRIPILESQSGILTGNAVRVLQGNTWIPVQLDLAHNELRIPSAMLKAKIPLDITIQDAAGNSATLRRTLPQ